MTGLLAIGTSCLAFVNVNGRRRLPLPPLSTRPFSEPPLPAETAAPSRLWVTATVVAAMLRLQKRPSRLLVTGMRDQRPQFRRGSGELGRVRQEVTRAVKENVHTESHYSMKQRAALPDEH